MNRWNVKVLAFLSKEDYEIYCDSLMDVLKRIEYMGARYHEEWYLNLLEYGNGYD